MPYFHLHNKADPTKRVSWPAPGNYDPHRVTRRRSSEQVIAGPTKRQSFAIEETDREVPLSGIVHVAYFEKLSFLYQMPTTDFVFSDGTNVWEVTFDDFQGTRNRTSKWYQYTITLGVTKRLRGGAAPVFAPEVQVALINWPELSPSVVNGSNTVFSTVGGKEFQTGCVAVAWNGIVQEPGTQFTEVANTAVQLLQGAPIEEPVGQPHHVTLWYTTRGTPSNWMFPRLAVGVVDGVNDVFTCPSGHVFYSGRVAVFLNGLLLVPVKHYAELPGRTGVAIGGTVGIDPPSGTDRVMLMYFRDPGGGIGAGSLAAGGVVWPVESPDAPDSSRRSFGVPVGISYRNRKIATFRSGLLLTPGVGAVQEPLLLSTNLPLGDPPMALEESVVHMFEPY